MSCAALWRQTRGQRKKDGQSSETIGNVCKNCLGAPCVLRALFGQPAAQQVTTNQPCHVKAFIGLTGAQMTPTKCQNMTPSAAPKQLQRTQPSNHVALIKGDGAECVVKVVRGGFWAATPVSKQMSVCAKKKSCGLMLRARVPFSKDSVSVGPPKRAAAEQAMRGLNQHQLSYPALPNELPPSKQCVG